jgi:hypothetical protein
MATDIEAKIDATSETKLETKAEAGPEAKSEATSETKSELPFVSLIDAPAAPAQAPPAKMSAAPGPAISAAKADLPEVEPLKPDAGDQTLRLAIEMAAARSADETRRKFFSMPVPAAAAPRQSWRTPLAAAVVFAALGGAAFGSLSGASLGYLWFGTGGGSNKIEASTLQTMKAELAELATLKASVDGATRGANGQFAKLADRLDRVEHAQAEPSAKLTHIAEAVDRLEKKNVAAVAAAAASAAPETTGSIGGPPATIDAAKSDKLLQDWIVQDVRRGRALVASRFGGVFEITVGNMLPGLGHVQAIRRQDGQWVVLTDRGLIGER